MLAGVSCRVLRGREKSRENLNGLFPFLSFNLELFPARPRKPVELCLSVVIGNSPLGSDRTLLLELEKRGIQRSIVQGKQVSAGLFYAATYTVAVERSECFKGLENHQRKRSLPDIRFIAHPVLLEWSPIGWPDV